MLCGICKIEKKESDFINSKDVCYKCLYQIKKQKPAKKNAPKKCRICHAEIAIPSDSKKRNRTIFCSVECAKEGHRDQIDQHWTRRIRRWDAPQKKGHNCGLQFKN